MPLKLKRFLVDLLDILREDHLSQLKEITKDARGITCLQMLDKETAIIQVQNGKIFIKNKVRKKEINVRVWITKECLFRILEGKSTLDEAFNNGELEVIGDPLILIRCYGIWEKVISLSRKSPRFYFLTYQLK